MKLPNLRADLRLFAAPLAGCRIQPTGRLLSAWGADYTFTEMVSSEGLVRNNFRTLEMLRKYPGETAVGCQLFGTRPEAVAISAQIVEEHGFDSVDLNCGCPVRKVVHKCGGAALLNDLCLLEQIISTAVRRISIPFSIKIRSGWNQSNINYLEVGKVAEGAGAAYICLHARTQSERFGPEVHLEHIRLLKESLSIPVVGNGGIRCADDAITMMRQTGCDGVMVASETLGNPFIFREIMALLTTGKNAPPPEVNERVAICLEHVRLLVGRCGETRGIKRSRKLLGWYYRYITGRRKVDQELFRLNTYDEVEDHLRRLLRECERV